jgi:hypothetical protein
MGTTDQWPPLVVSAAKSDLPHDEFIRLYGRIILHDETRKNKP